MKWPICDEMAAINRRRDAIHVASVLYYHFDFSMFSDHFFDKLCRELVELHEAYPHLVRQGYEWEAFKSFDGGTGFHLPHTPYVMRQAELTIEAFAKHGQPIIKKEMN